MAQKTDCDLMEDGVIFSICKLVAVVVCPMGKKNIQYNISVKPSVEYVQSKLAVNKSMYSIFHRLQFMVPMQCYA